MQVARMQHRRNENLRLGLYNRIFCKNMRGQEIPIGPPRVVPSSLRHNYQAAFRVVVIGLTIT
jgi:hypothetical protein